MIRRPPRSTLFPTRRSSDLVGRTSDFWLPWRRHQRGVRCIEPRGKEDQLHPGPSRGNGGLRSEEHTSELQSQSNIVCRLLLEKKKRTRLSPSTFLFRRRLSC